MSSPFDAVDRLPLRGSVLARSLRAVSVLVLALPQLGCPPDGPSLIMVHASISPQAIDPGDTITVTYQLVADGPQRPRAERVELTGLPVNTVGKGTPVPLPAVASNVETQAPVVVTAPAADGVYQLRVTAYWDNGRSSVFSAVGPLTIRDAAAVISQVTLAPDAHALASDCGSSVLHRTLTWQVHDDNGADDVLDPEISSFTGPSAALPVSTPPIRLTPNPAADDDLVDQTFTDVVDLHCDVDLGAYVWTFQVREDDKSAGVGPHPTFSTTGTYRVNP